MDDRRKEYLDILSRKLSALVKILDITDSYEFTGSGSDEHMEQEAESFASLYEERAEIITEIEKMDAALVPFKDLESDKKTVQAGKSVLNRIKETAKAITERDKKNMEISANLTAFLKGNLKKIRDGRDVSNAYTEAQRSSSGYYFDSTK
jgi:hypothetical protein